MVEQPQVVEQAKVECPFCGDDTSPEVGKIFLFVNDQTVLIENVPARICQGCKEEFYDDAILFQIEQLRAKTLPASQAQRILKVPVFRWEDL